MSDLTHSPQNPENIPGAITRQAGFKLAYNPQTGLIEGRFITSPRFAEIVLDSMQVEIKSIVEECQAKEAEARAAQAAPRAQTWRAPPPADPDPWGPPADHEPYRF
jgi:hypothetical protein